LAATSRQQEVTKEIRMTMDSKLAAIARAVLRVVLGLLMLEHGSMKLFAFPAMVPGAPNPLPVLLLVAGLLEVAFGLMLALGLFSRVAAFILSGEMAIAYFMVHAPLGFWPALNGGELAAVLSFSLLTLAVPSPDAWAVDNLIRCRRLRTVC
jgi:putative oxidoreductase